MNLVKYDQDYFDLEEFLDDLQYFEDEEKPPVRRMRREYVYREDKGKQNKGKLREIKRNQENME